MFNGPSGNDSFIMKIQSFTQIIYIYILYYIHKPIEWRILKESLDKPTRNNQCVIPTTIIIYIGGATAWPV
jgi:hypothetical protein